MDTQIANFNQAANEGMTDLLEIAGVKVSHPHSLDTIHRKKEELKDKGYRFHTYLIREGVQMLQSFSFKGEFVAGNYIAIDPLTMETHRILIDDREEMQGVINEIKKGGRTK